LYFTFQNYNPFIRKKRSTVKSRDSTPISIETPNSSGGKEGFKNDMEWLFSQEPGGRSISKSESSSSESEESIHFEDGKM